ncbi:MAG: DUF692 domain-containing protein [Betaproteobacteria bacterium]|nr:DUF692 domain-containing protein [Betaproteobacteria bacterium]
MSRPLHIESSRAGIGLRTPHYRAMLDNPPPVSFLEVHSENFFGDGGQPLRYLDRFREDYPVSTHGVGLSLGSADTLDPEHLRRLKRLVDRIEPTLVSEHLCWVGVNGRFLNDLLPIPYTEEALEHVIGQVGRVQDFLGRQIMVENVSSYLQFVDSSIPEWEFVREVAERAGCRILLDVNNIYVNSVNHGFDAHAYLDAIEPGSVGEIHLAGFQDTGEVLIDTHGSSVCEAVWKLYERAIKRLGPIPTLIEWDTDIPALEVLLDEAAKADRILAASECARHAA